MTTIIRMKACRKLWHRPPALEVVLGSAPQLLSNRTQDHGSLRTGATKLAATPDEPSTPEICDRPHENCVCLASDRDADSAGVKYSDIWWNMDQPKVGHAESRSRINFLTFVVARLSADRKVSAANYPECRKTLHIRGSFRTAILYLIDKLQRL